MAFAKASGYTNLNSGNFSPVIYSKKAQLAFRKSSVVEAVTNTDYSGEISQMGDSVRIIKEPTITINNLERGTALATQDLTDLDFTMTVDKANYWQFTLADIEQAASHINYMDLASDRAGYDLRDAFDAEVLGYMSGWKTPGAWARNTTTSGTVANAAAGTDELLAANKLDITDFGGSDLGVAGEVTSIPIAAGGGAGGITSPLAIMNRMNRLMDQANVATDGRYCVIDPVMAEILMDEDSKLINADFGGSDEIRNGKLPAKIRNFTVYVSNNLPYVGNGAGASLSTGSETNFSVMVAGHDSAVAVADQIAKVETFRSPTTFSDIVRGMQLYGRKVLRPEALFTANYNLA
tara:strand:- start:1811 stop:2860 length:1050 start_codon:yes stop_codon:yes gene_type:complete